MFLRIVKRSDPPYVTSSCAPHCGLVASADKVPREELKLREFAYACLCTTAEGHVLDAAQWSVHIVMRSIRLWMGQTQSRMIREAPT